MLNVHLMCIHDSTFLPSKYDVAFEQYRTLKHGIKEFHLNFDCYKLLCMLLEKL